MSEFNYYELDERQKRLMDAFRGLTDGERKDVIGYVRAVASGDRGTADRMMTGAMAWAERGI
jgi:hypothetical protein